MLQRHRLHSFYCGRRADETKNTTSACSKNNKSRKCTMLFISLAETSIKCPNQQWLLQDCLCKIELELPNSELLNSRIFFQCGPRFEKTFRSNLNLEVPGTGTIFNGWFDDFLLDFINTTFTFRIELVVWIQKIQMFCLIFAFKNQNISLISEQTIANN